MTIYCGFFNSVNGDRKYQADEMTKPYELLVSNGVFATPSGTPSNYLQVYANDGMRIRVATGRALFFDKWFVNDADLYLTVPTSEVTLKRIDSVVVRVDKSEAVRGATIYIKKGTPASSPTAPTLERTTLVKEYKLANITVDAGVTTITQAKINDRRAYTEECGWVTSLVKQVDTTTLWDQFYDDFYTWFGDIKEHLSTSTLIRTFTSTYVAETQDETVIPINIPQFTYNLDILQVYINGLMLIRDLEYTSTNDTEITLTNGVDVGTPISFVIYKSVDGRDAETVIEQVADLQADMATVQADIETANVNIQNNTNAHEELAGVVERAMATSTNGGQKISLTAESSLLEAFYNAGIGIHTVYCPNGTLDVPKAGAARAFGHMTTATYGWIFYLVADGSIYFNYCSAGNWVGWRTIYEYNPAPLWSSEAGWTMTADQTITPSKPLNQCAHGWELVWADDTSDTDIFVTHIPKKTQKNANWNGQQCIFGVPSFGGDTDGKAVVSCKRLAVTNTTLTGHAINNIDGTSADVRLFIVNEY